ncbi:hypothetical protein F5Y15DRAFT_428547 [Xylariaceae sp. FL0016]|nr:hypothetical protein F5Y15DRAFT_428547 [Xylariaceae sp. FL0016]
MTDIFFKILTCFTTYLSARHEDRTGERSWHITRPCLSIAAFALPAGATSTAPHFVSMMLMVPGMYFGYSVLFAWTSNPKQHLPAKRAAAIAMVNAFGNIANVISIFMYPASASPR